MTPNANALIKIRYILQLNDTDKEVFDITIDKSTGRSISSNLADIPDWTKLNFEQCPNCPLSSTDVEHCPAAISLVDMAKRIGDVLSHAEIYLVVMFDERWVGKKASSQEVVSSLMGLHMATSGCPHTDYLKPMARFHLPLSTADETLVRTTGFYFLQQYFKLKSGDIFDTDLSGLADLYSEMQTVNASIAKRLRASGEFSEINSLTILDTYAQVIPLQIEDRLDEIQSLFGN